MSSQVVKIRPTDTGKVLWNTIAPVMLPSARVSLRWRIQSTELNFSGSSVAIGVISRETMSGAAPSDSLRTWTSFTKISAPRMMPRMAAPICRKIR